MIRAKIVLLAAEGTPNSAITDRLDLHVHVISRWPKRFCDEGPAGLKDRKRSGRPRSFPADVVAEVKAMTCEPPSARAVPLSRWSSVELAAQAVAESLAVSESASTVRRWLAEDAIKPWQFRSWIFPRDPEFAVKAARVLDLYQRVWEGVELGEDEYVISADEKSQLQTHVAPSPRGSARAGAGPAGGVRIPPARHPGLLGRLRRAPRPLIGLVEPSTGIVPFGGLVDQVMSSEP